MDWHRRRDLDGETYYVEKRGRYLIDKKVTDDREYDGGYLTIEWILHAYSPLAHTTPSDYLSGFYPVEGRETLRAAKKLAEQFEEGRWAA